MLIATGVNTHQFPGEDLLVEVELYLLVSNVNTQLLERIGLEVLEAEDVKNANSIFVVFAVYEGQSGVFSRTNTMAKITRQKISTNSTASE